ncbi:Alpha/beta hydrolase family protein [Paenibacillus sp. UNCCL117]|uniref:alpha/beta fold hydrolase n=1 Tax=unclassified Paenibacillus TaxID=185978 RepID=UPI0008899AB1|nr:MULTISPECIES: alpha/beta fold hydrolase [unclassified Paenibacillus]SDD77260.1 Alpha/beta hydrolase family protein [Paenibacillus sp. cl123]SFW52672.1 Alpha/beta hydrolase family protein [Paenibacillus sp. UNCCL117]
MPDTLTIFLTGGTGFIGKRITSALAGPGRRLQLLVRTEGSFRSLLRHTGLSQADGIEPVLGDLSRPKLGLTEQDYKRLCDKTDVIIHAGGPMNITLGEAEAASVFDQASGELARLARHIHQARGLRHLIHLVGFKSPVTAEDAHKPLPEQLMKGQPPYERAKFMADWRLRQSAHQDGYPLSVVHPGVVIGDTATGSTEQTAGLGLLVTAVARGRMPLVPGGATHWLPLIHADQIAEAVRELALQKIPAGDTYYLLNNRRPLGELVADIARTLRVPGPVSPIPIGPVRRLMHSPAGNWLGVPPESLDFLADGEYPMDSLFKLQRAQGLPPLEVKHFPHVVADLDYRLHHPAGSAVETDSGFTRGKRGPLATLERGGDGAPIVFLHGLLGSADTWLPVAERLPEPLRQRPLWLADLSGFGRSPFHGEAGDRFLGGFVRAVAEAVRTAGTPVTLVGHSFGALIALRLRDAAPELVSAALLLQPTLSPAPARYRLPRSLLRLGLRRMTADRLRRLLEAEASFPAGHPVPDSFIAHALAELGSTRVRATTADALALLASGEDAVAWGTVGPPMSVLWGVKDRAYRLPERLSAAGGAGPAASGVPTVYYGDYGHYFPVSHPGETAEWIGERVLSAR